MLILDKPLALERLIARAARARIPAVFALPPPAARWPGATTAAPALPTGAWLWSDAAALPAPDHEPVLAR